jgi:hypothetical protein
MGVSGDDMDQPNGNDGGMTPTQAPTRPDPMRWLWYTFGGGIGSRYREWVLHDVTSRTRWVRQVARPVVQAATIGALLILLLGFGWFTWVLLIGGLLLTLIYYVVFFDAFAEHRLFQHGYPWGTAQRIVNERDGRRAQIGYAATRRPIAPIPVNSPLNGVAMISKRLNPATIGTRQQRLAHRSPRIGQHCAPGTPNTVVHNRPHARGHLLDLDRIAVDREL